MALSLQNEAFVMAPPRVAILSRDPAFAESLRASFAATIVALPAGGSDRVPADADVVVLEDLGHEEEQRVIEHLRCSAPLAEVVVIATHRPMEEAMSALRSGVFAVLTYPVSTDELVNEITRATSRKRRAEARIRQLESDESSLGASPAPAPRRRA